jgi:hypothetical protein
VTDHDLAALAKWQQSTQRQAFGPVCDMQKAMAALEELLESREGLQRVRRHHSPLADIESRLRTLLDAAAPLALRAAE